VPSWLIFKQGYKSLRDYAISLPVINKSLDLFIGLKKTWWYNCFS